MDLPANVGRLHQFQTQNDAGPRAIRSAMIQKREAVERLEDEIAQLVENKKRLEEDLVRLGVALDHSLLPNEVLSHIFILLAFGHGTVRFPILKKKHPSTTLRTPELWSDTDLFLTNHCRGGNRNCFHQRWVSRARTLPVTLSADFPEPEGNGLADALWNILVPIQVKRLSLCLTYKHPMGLSTLPEAALSCLSEFEVELMFHDRSMDGHMNGPHPLITRLRSVTFLGHESSLLIDSLRPSFPWSQLRSLKFEFFMEGLEDLIISILRQIPMLEVLSLQIYGIGVWEQLTMPSLRNLTLQLGMANGTEIDNILRSFMCPNLTHFTLKIRDNCQTCETFDILKQQYNMQELREAHFWRAFVLPVSSLLRAAPILHSLSLRRNAMMDEEALIGISNGTFGRFLRKLEIDIRYDVGEVLDMVEARKMTVDGLIKNGCSWREAITSLKDIMIHTTDGEHGRRGLPRKDYCVGGGRYPYHCVFCVLILIYTVIPLQVSDPFATLNQVSGID